MWSLCVSVCMCVRARTTAHHTLAVTLPLRHARPLPFLSCLIFICQSPNPARKPWVLGYHFTSAAMSSIFFARAFNAPSAEDDVCCDEGSLLLGLRYRLLACSTLDSRKEMSPREIFSISATMATRGEFAFLLTTNKLIICMFVLAAGKVWEVGREGKGAHYTPPR